MGKGKSKPNKRPRKPVKKKRQLPEGLRRWNQVRSHLSGEYKKTGKTINGVSLNVLTKTFLLEYYDQEFTQGDIDQYLRLEVPLFYANALNVSNDSLLPFKYFDLDRTIRGLPTGIMTTVNAGGFGACKIYTATYDYHASGARDIVEEIRKVAENESAGFNFHGLIVQNNDPDREKNGDPEYIVSYTLYVRGTPIVSLGSNSVIPPSTPEDDDASMEARLKKMDEKVDLNEAKKKERRKKEAAKVEESKEERLLKLQNENLRLQNEKAKNILELIRAGYTKAEIKKMGF